MRIQGTTDSLNFKFDQNDYTIILLNGYELISFDDGKLFLEFFKFNKPNISANKGISELNWFSEMLQKVIAKVDKDLLSHLSKEKKPNLFIHWGGVGRKNASARLRKVAELSDFPFRIYDFSVRDREEYKKFKNGDITEIKEAEKSLIEKSAEVNRRIYEFMETILLKNSDKYLKTIKDNKIEPFIFSDAKIYREAKWILEELKYFLQKSGYVKDESKKKEILTFFEDQGKFSTVIGLKEEPNIEIKDIKKFRSILNEFLALLPEDIYPQES